MNAEWAGPLVIERQGSFYVGGREVTAGGRYEPMVERTPPNTGQTFWVDQMYVHYQIPPQARRLPLVLVHGGGGTGAVWETTPDGREGFQTLFLRRGYAVYTVDTPHGGRSGYPSFTGAFGRLDEQQQVIPNFTSRPGREHAWIRWRMGPRHPQVFPVQAFPMEAIDPFLKAVRPVASEDAELVATALVALLEKIGPAVLVTHSNSGDWGWLAAARSAHVQAVVSYEPGYVFPADEMPPPVPLHTGALAAGTAMTEAEFARLARIPIQVVFGDNIPTDPVPELPADCRRAQLGIAKRFTAALNRRGGRASVLKLPEVGLRGNSHFMFLDRNNVQVADQLSSFLSAHGLDA